MTVDDLLAMFDRPLFDTEALRQEEAARDELANVHWGPSTQQTHEDDLFFLHRRCQATLTADTGLCLPWNQRNLKGPGREDADDARELHLQLRWPIHARCRFA